MDFSNSGFPPSAAASNLANDTLTCNNLVMACRWGWTSTPEPEASAKKTFSSPSQSPIKSPAPHNNVLAKRFAPCQGRFYHQLQCSQRIRTDLVEDCGANCVEPVGDIDIPFICFECIRIEANKVWEQRESGYNAQYPPIKQMTKDVYNQWYAGLRQMEDAFRHDLAVYKYGLMNETRPSNICAAPTTSQEDKDFASEIDSLSLSQLNSNATAAEQQPVQLSGRRRINLMNDASEQLHWNLQSLALERGSCGIEYAGPSPVREPTRRQFEEEMH